MAKAIPGFANAEPGIIIEVAQRLQVSCGDGILEIEELQMPGGKRIQAKDFILGRKSAGIQLLGQKIGLPLIEATVS